MDISFISVLCNSIHVPTKNSDHYVGTGSMMTGGHIRRLAELKECRNKKIGSNIILNLMSET